MVEVALPSGGVGECLLKTFQVKCITFFYMGQGIKIWGNNRQTERVESEAWVLRHFRGKGIWKAPPYSWESRRPCTYPGFVASSETTWEVSKLSFLVDFQKLHKKNEDKGEVVNSKPKASKWNGEWIK